MRFLLLFLSLFTTFFKALIGLSTATDDVTDARYIGSHYETGVVKILVYDPVIEKKFDLKKGDGYLTRGSGFIVSPSGILFTNKHVIEWCVFGYAVVDWQDKSGVLHQSDVLTYEPGLESRADVKKIYYVGHAKPYIQVFSDATGKNYQIYNAQVLSMGETFDGAMLKIVSDENGDPVNRQFTALPIGNSDKVQLGEDLVVLGFPSQYEKSDYDLDLRDTLTMSYGKHSGWDYVFDQNYGFIKTSAAVHEGNSGGPVFGDRETVIGIATAMGLRTQIGLVEGINGMYFVVEPDQVILKDLMRRGLTPPSNIKRFKAVSGNPRPLPSIKFVSSSAANIQTVRNASVLLNGVVLRADNRHPIAGAEITLWKLDGASQKTEEHIHCFSDRTGKFVFQQPVQVGFKYHIVVKSDNFKEMVQEVFIGSKGQNFITIRLLTK